MTVVNDSDRLVEALRIIVQRDDEVRTLEIKLDNEQRANTYAIKVIRERAEMLARERAWMATLVDAFTGPDGRMIQDD